MKSKSFLPVVLSALLLILSGCAKSPDSQKMNAFIDQLSSHSRNLESGGTTTIKIEGLAGGEQLIIANGAQGRVSVASGLDAALIADVEKRIKAEGERTTLLLLVREGRIVGEKKLSADNLITDFVPIENNIKVAQGDREFYIECVARPQPAQSGSSKALWNDACYSVLSELAL